MNKPTRCAVKAWINSLPIWALIVWGGLEVWGWPMFLAALGIAVAGVLALFGYWRLTDWIERWIVKRWDLK